MPAYTVEQIIGDPRDWQTKAGKSMKSYLLKVSGEDRNVELSQYPDTEPPTVGLVIDGTLEESTNGNFPPKLKRARQGGFGAGQTGKDWEASGRAQGRAHAQEMSLRLAALKLQSGEVSSVDSALLLPLIDWFYDDAQAALAKDYRK